jgi:hypothetical protein
VLVDKSGVAWNHVQVVDWEGEEEPLLADEGAGSPAEGEEDEELPPTGWVRSYQVQGRVTYILERRSD